MRARRAKISPSNAVSRPGAGRAGRASGGRSPAGPWLVASRRSTPQNPPWRHRRSRRYVIGRTYGRAARTLRRAAGHQLMLLFGGILHWRRPSSRANVWCTVVVVVVWVKKWRLYGCCCCCCCWCSWTTHAVHSVCTVSRRPHDDKKLND